MRRLIDGGLPFMGGVWLDTYNQAYSIGYCGTITTRINEDNNHWCSHAYETD